MVKWYNTFFCGARGLWFTSRAGQIGQSVANGSLPLRHFFKMKRVARVQWRGDGPYKLVTRFGVMQRVKWKIWFWYKYYKCYTLASSQFYFQCRPNLKADLFFCVHLENLAEYLQNFCSYKICCNDYNWSLTKLRLPRQRLKKSHQSCKVQARTREVIWSQNQAGKKNEFMSKNEFGYWNDRR